MHRRVWPIPGIVIFSALLAGCADDGPLFKLPACKIAIEVPTSEPTYETTESGLIVGGSASGVSYVTYFNADTGEGEGLWEGVSYGHPGLGGWAFHSGIRIAQGSNTITVSARRNGIDDSACAVDTIEVTGMAATP